MSDAVEVSIVIPVFNEEAILHAAVVDLRERLSGASFDYEILLAENGSRDATPSIAAELVGRYPEVETFSLPEANYGLALRIGIGRARGAIVICDEIDLCDAAFHRRAFEALRDGEADMIIGSKLMAGAQDERPFMRHAASHLYTRVLQAVLGFRGTDTHGLKAFRREVVGPIAARCVVDKDVFASELVIRCYRAGVSVREIPVRLLEKRPPSIGLLRRVPGVVTRVARLRWAIGRRP
jgi:glycosyltransferase involved in cell wall biosynthesis